MLRSPHDTTSRTAAPCETVPAPRAGRRRRRLLRPALLASAVSLCLVAAGAPPEPLGIGDRLFPYLGNPGYDVASYDLDLVYPGSNDKPLRAVTTIDAWTTAPLERVNLDFAQGKVESVQVDGEPAAFARAGEDLVVTPKNPLPVGSWMRITVRHTSDPVPPAGGESGWVRTADGLAMANQADAAHLVFPCNDHPSDKAMFTFRVTAPDGYTAVANGLPAGVERAGGNTTWTYRTQHPMATELAQVSIGRSAVLRREGPHGLPLRDVVPAKEVKALEPWLKKTPEQISWMEQRVGPYPFETYGLLMASASTGFELETQTLSLFEKDLFTERAYPAWYLESIMVHELAHQWFGDSVSPRVWSDLWLNEGHATWYEALYAEERSAGKEGGEAGARAGVKDGAKDGAKDGTKAGHTLEARMKNAYANSDRWRASGGPPARPKGAAPGQKISIFRPNVYDGAALILFALREEIGRPAFEKLERAWVHRYRDGVASTDDYVRLASRTAGRDLHDFFEGWLYGEKTPPMPNHPDWKTAAPTQGPPSAKGPERTPAQGGKGPSPAAAPR